MSANFYELLKYANTGIASPGMTYYDKMRALAMTGGGTIKTLTGIPPLSFTGNGSPLISLSMLGNVQQTGTPSPDNIIMPDFCGKLVGTDWTIPITCAGQTVPVYLGQTQTVRRVKKLVLTGNENWIKWDLGSKTFQRFYFTMTSDKASRSNLSAICSHFIVKPENNKETLRFSASGGAYIQPVFVIAKSRLAADDVASFKAWLAAQYAAGTPVTIWYVLAEPETAIVNEPLAKIGDYADELHSTDAGVSIPTSRGENVLTVDTDLQPSSVTIRYKADE